jgi:hypothetical protein
MPMQRDLYPSDWDEIARSIKEAAGWQCQECGKPCLGHPDCEEIAILGNRSERAKVTLTVAHLNHQPADCHPENLRALCAPCHCRYDLRPASMAIKKRLKQERMGQLTLPLPQ